MPAIIKAPATIQAFNLYAQYKEKIIDLISELETQGCWDCDFEDEYLELCESIGISVVDFSGSEYDYLEKVVGVGVKAFRAEQNIVLLSPLLSETVVVILANDQNEAEKKIEELHDSLMKFKHKYYNRPFEELPERDDEKNEKAMLEYLLKKYGGSLKVVEK